MNAFVFDFDGPLFDGRGAAERALGEAVEHFAKELGEPEIPFATLPLLRPPNLLAALYAELRPSSNQLETIEKFYRRRLQVAEKAVKAHDCVVRLLRELRARDYRLGILSARREKSLLAHVKRLGIERYFSSGDGPTPIVGRDTVAPPKPDPTPLLRLAKWLGVDVRQLVFVGDTDSDYLCARDAGAIYYHVRWSGEPNHLASANARHVIETRAELYQALLFSNVTVSSALGASSPGRSLTEAIDNGNVCFYAGAGVSVPSGIGSWEGHYRPVLEELGAGFLLDIGLDLPAVLQLLVSRRDLAKQVWDRFKDSFDVSAVRPNPYHYAMLRSTADRIWTTNYDELFEKANSIAGFGHRVIRDDAALIDNFRHRKLIIKMHGDFSSGRFDERLDWNLVLTQEQFDLVDRRRKEIWRLFEDDYRNRCFVFVGVSFEDPALRRIVAIARQRIPRTRYNHMLLAKRAYDPIARHRQDLHALSLQRHDIETRFFEDFSDVEQFVRDCALRTIRPIAGVSGSVPKRPESDEPNGPGLDVAQLDALCGVLGASLAKSGFRVTSGGAQHVGVPAVSRAFDTVPSSARLYLRRREGEAYVRTAPVVIVPGEAPNPYEAMRRRFLGEVAVLIVIGGGSGVREEIAIAEACNIPMALIPHAGGTTADYYKDFMGRLAAIYPDDRLARAVREVNKAIAGVKAAELSKFVEHELPEKLRELVLTFMGSAMPAGKLLELSSQW